ncbi:MAG: hypothetical protein KIS92_11690 [Planctomycetota bacterium]|nr:hypothetical protein [Planctomycetota bacterium]
MLRKLFEFLASLKLALLLLAVLIVACAVGTWYESKLNADVARAYVYNAWWFNVWMAVLVVNLFCAAAIRYPWKPHQTGFVITHAGIITMLVGGMIDREWGVEGYVELNRGDAPLRTMSLQDQEFYVYEPGRSNPASTVFRVRAAMEGIYGPSLLNAADVADWPGLFRVLAEDGPMTAGSPARAVYRNLPDDLKKTIKDKKDAAAESKASCGELLAVLNDLQTKRDFYTEREFGGAALPEEAKRLLAEPRALLSAREVQYLNRLLLEAGFPGVFRARAPKTSPMAIRTLGGVRVRAIDMQPASWGIVGLKPDAAGAPAVAIKLETNMMNQDFHLALGQSEVMGFATFGLLKGLPPKPEPKVPDAIKKPEPGKQVRSLEVHFTYSKHDEQIPKVAGRPANAHATLRLDEKTGEPSLTLEMGGKSFTFAPKEMLGKELALDGLPEWKIAVLGYYANFKMEAVGKYISDGEKPENPCVHFELRGPMADAAAQKAPGAHGGEMDVPEEFGDASKTYFNLYVGEDGKLRYALRSRTLGEKTGEIALGEAVELGWATRAGADLHARATVTAFEPNATLVREWRPVDADPQEAMPIAIKCEVSEGGETKSVWVGPSRPAQIMRTPLEVGGKTVELAFAHREQELPFTVELLKFSAPNQEGMEGSAQFAAFESTLSFDGQRDTVVLRNDSKYMRFRDVQQAGGVLKGAITHLDENEVHLTIEGQDVKIEMAEILSLDRQSQKIHMNHPTTFPKTWYGPWLGTSYKFSQASHDPRRPEFSAVQVLRDPGWMPKWVGSLMICFGIFTMFYLKPYFRRASEPAAAKAAVEPAKSRKTSKNAMNDVAVKGT